MDDGARRSQKFSNFLPLDFLEALGSDGVKFLALKVSPEFAWAEALQGSELHISDDGLISLETPNSEVQLDACLADSEWSQLLCLAPTKQGQAKLKICGRVDVALQLRRASKILRAADSAAQMTQEELRRQQEAGKKAKKGQRKAEAKRRAETRSRCQLPTLGDALCGVAWDFSQHLEPILKEDAWDGTGPAPEVARRQSEGSSRIPAEMLGSQLKVKVVELESGQSFKVAYWSMGDFGLDGIGSMTFTSYQLERQGAKSRTKIQLTGKALDSPDLHVLGHAAKAFPPFDQVTLIGVYLEGSEELQICPCTIYNIEVDRQGKGYSDPNDPVNANREEEEQAPAEEAAPSTAKQYRDKRKVAIDSFGTAKKMRSFGAVAERLDRECEVANLEQYTGSITDRVEEQLKAKQTAEEKDQQTKLEILPPYVRSDDPKKIYADGLQSIVSDDALEDEKHLLDEGILALVKGNAKEILSLDETKGQATCHSLVALAVLKARAVQAANPPSDPKMFTKKIGVLNWLVTLLEKDPKRIQVGTKSFPSVLGLGVVETSQAMLQLYRYCFDPMVAGRGKRELNVRKALCAAIIWALHLTPGLWIDVTRTAAKELKDEKNFQVAARYVGCQVEQKSGGGSGIRVALKGPPEFNEKVIGMQARGPKTRR